MKSTTPIHKIKTECTSQNANNFDRFKYSWSTRKIKPEKALQDLPASTKRLAAEDAACRYWKWYVDDEEGMTVTYQAIFWKNPHRVEIIMPNTGGG
ncbi:hypothetical protein RI196_11590 [Aeribacillus composti]|uniref:Uncharacterized protein n=1 Tax=Aeribacillus composti TaxID=1868734 RepID=A0ABY9W7W3_9BACI|nr:hypothetical protein [Aeribacillus composti]WNF31935.1 hypothetical protein RI196_11590 [Aeribacillus composti]